MESAVTILDYSPPLQPSCPHLRVDDTAPRRRCIDCGAEEYLSETCQAWVRVEES